MAENAAAHLAAQVVAPMGTRVAATMAAHVAAPMAIRAAASTAIHVAAPSCPFGSTNGYPADVAAHAAAPAATLRRCGRPCGCTPG